MTRAWAWIIEHWELLSTVGGLLATAGIGPWLWHRAGKPLWKRYLAWKNRWRDGITHVLKEQTGDLKKIMHQLYPNNGGSMFDKLDQLADTVATQTVQNDMLLRRLRAAAFNADASGATVSVTDEWVALARFDRRAALDQGGWGWTLAVHEDDRERVLKTWVNCLKHGLPFSATYRFENTGKKVRATAVPVPRGDRIVCWLGVVEEIIG